jgi:branched-chain amino acid transport system substrate-binding protein
MQKKGDDGVRFDNEGSGYGFKTERYLLPSATAQPSTCTMTRY